MSQGRAYLTVRRRRDLGGVLARRWVLRFAGVLDVAYETIECDGQLVTRHRLVAVERAAGCGHELLRRHADHCRHQLRACGHVLDRGCERCRTESQHGGRAEYNLTEIPREHRDFPPNTSPYRLLHRTTDHSRH